MEKVIVQALFKRLKFDHTKQNYSKSLRPIKISEIFRCIGITYSWSEHTSNVSTQKSHLVEFAVLEKHKVKIKESGNNWCLYFQSLMGKLSFKLHKNERNTDISLYQLHLPKLYKNILKYYRLNSFKEIAIGFNHGLHTTLGFLADVSDGSFVLFGRCSPYLCLQFILSVSENLFALSHNRTPHINKVAGIRGTRRPYVWGDMVSEIAWQPTLGSPTWFVWCRDLLLDVGFSICHPLDSGLHSVF